MNPLLAIDLYKADHRSQYPVGTEKIYSNFTPRKSRIPGVDKIVFFGLQRLMKKWLVDAFDILFSDVGIFRSEEYKSFLAASLGPSSPSVDHVMELQEIGYLPIRIKALPEGSVVPIQTPCMTIENTLPEFFWLTNYLETLISAELWKPCTTATIARALHERFTAFAELTGGDAAFTPWQGHDFSMRGMSSVEDAACCGVGHLLSFRGTDTLPALYDAVEYYNADLYDIGGSVPATEHSVMCAGDEKDTIVRLLTEVYPSGIVSVVCDSYDFWGIVTEFLPSIRDIIMNRDGKFVVRPDSGTPHLVLCGDPNGETDAEKKGLVQCLYETFGGTVNEKGYKVLDSHVGAIYGDSIDINEQLRIMHGLKINGFASTNVVLGIGSFSYQYVTRDTLGFVCKATNCTVNGQDKAIFKSPKTGQWKKSHRGLLRVNEDYSVDQDCTREQESGGLLRTVFEDGRLVVDDSLSDIRGRLANSGSVWKSREFMLMVNE